MPKIQIDCFIDEFSTPNREWNYKKFKNHFISEHKCLNFLLHREKTKLDEIKERKLTSYRSIFFQPFFKENEKESQRFFSFSLSRILLDPSRVSPTWVPKSNSNIYIYTYIK